MVEGRPVMIDNDILNQNPEFAMFRKPEKL
jgi:hypothetical protein